MTNENDLITRADAFEAVCESCELWIMHGLNKNTECPYYANECAEIKALKAIPSTEAVQGWIPCSEPIRCGECKHQDECEEVVLFDVNDDEVMGHRLHWCSYGERKGGDSE